MSLTFDDKKTEHATRANCVLYKKRRVVRWFTLRRLSLYSCIPNSELRSPSAVYQPRRPKKQKAGTKAAGGARRTRGPPQRWSTPPGGSVRGERANFTRLVLGCIEAKFCPRRARKFDWNSARPVRLESYTRWKALAEIYTMHSFALL